MGSIPTEVVNKIFNIHFYALVQRHNVALIFAIQHAISPKFAGKFGAECLNTTLCLSTPSTPIPCGIQRKAVRTIFRYHSREINKQTTLSLVTYEMICHTLEYTGKLSVKRKFFYQLHASRMYPAHSRVGRGNLVLRHFVPHFLPNSGGFAC